MKPISPAKVPALCEVPFEFVNARLRGRRSRFYEGPRLRALARERTVPELALRLYPREDIRDRLALERRILPECVAELASVADYVGGRYGAFYGSLLRRYAVENLKVLLRLFVGADGEQDPADLLIELPRRLSLPVREVTAGADVEEFLSRIPQGPVRQCAQAALPLYEQSGRTAYLEMAFDKGYWLGVWEGVRRLPRGERGPSSAPIRNEYDTMRLVGTMRASATYGIPWEQWEPLLPAGGDGIPVAALRHVHANPHIRSALEAVPWLARVLSRYLPLNEAADLGRLEGALWRETVRLANRQYYGRLSGPAVLASYFYLKREELHCLLGLTQMLRYGEEEAQVVRSLGL